MVRELLVIACSQALPMAQIRSVGNCRAALTSCRNQAPDLVILDLVLPDGDGLDLLPELFALAPTAKVIASSGHLDHPVMLDHRKFGFSAVLEKPYKLEKLQQVIEAVIDTTV